MHSARFPRTFVNSVPCDSEFVIIFVKTMYIKKIITSRFCFRDILNNQGPSSLSLQLGWYHFSWTWLLRISQKSHGNPVLFMVECFMRQPSIYAVSMLVFIPVPFQRQHSLCSIYQCLTSLIKTWKNIKESEQKA